jgi:hypothetical protein
MAWEARSALKAEAASLVLRAQPEADNLIYAKDLLVGDRGYTDWTYELLASVAEAITAGQDLPLVVTVRNSGERAGRSSWDPRVNTQVLLR